MKTKYLQFVKIAAPYLAAFVVSGQSYVSGTITIGSGLSQQVVLEYYTGSYWQGIGGSGTYTANGSFTISGGAPPAGKEVRLHSYYTPSGGAYHSPQSLGIASGGALTVSVNVNFTGPFTAVYSGLSGTGVSLGNVYAINQKIRNDTLAPRAYTWAMEDSCGNDYTGEASNVLPGASVPIQITLPEGCLPGELQVTRYTYDAEGNPVADGSLTVPDDDSSWELGGGSSTEVTTPGPNVNPPQDTQSQTNGNITFGSAPTVAKDETLQTGFNSLRKAMSDLSASVTTAIGQLKKWFNDHMGEGVGTSINDAAEGEQGRGETALGNARTSFATVSNVVASVTLPTRPASFWPTEALLGDFETDLEAGALADVCRACLLMVFGIVTFFYVLSTLNESFVEWCKGQQAAAVKEGTGLAQIVTIPGTAAALAVAIGLFSAYALTLLGTLALAITGAPIPEALGEMVHQVNVYVPVTEGFAMFVTCVLSGHFTGILLSLGMLTKTFIFK